MSLHMLIVQMHIPRRALDLMVEAKGEHSLTFVERRLLQTIVASCSAARDSMMQVPS